MTFTTYKNIIDSYADTDFELQLEGGEPLICENLYLFLEYAKYDGPHKGKCKKINILTNGIELKKHLKKLVDLQKWFNIPFEIKVSVNYWLIKEHENHLKEISDCVFATEYIPDFNIVLNTRKRHDDDWIDNEIKKYGMENINHSFYLQSYGKMSGSNYDGVKIVQEIEDNC